MTKQEELKFTGNRVPTAAKRAGFDLLGSVQLENRVAAKAAETQSALASWEGEGGHAQPPQNILIDTTPSETGEEKARALAVDQELGGNG